MNILEIFFPKRKAESLLYVDYDQPPALPKGATEILWHHPIGSGRTLINLGQLRIEQMPRGSTYAQYRDEHAEHMLADGLVLDALIDKFVCDGRVNSAAVKEFLGDFTGQLFFLGTGFGAQGGKEYVACLNWQTHHPFLRFLCPADDPINHDVNCCACHFDHQVQ